MPRSSQSKSHKHNSRELVKEHPDDDSKNNLLSVEKRKFDMFGNNSDGDSIDVSKRRKENVEKSKGKEAKESVELKSKSSSSRRNESSGRVYSKRKYEKGTKECREIKGEKGEDREDVAVVKKKRLRLVDVSEDRKLKRDGVQNPELEKELEKKVQKRQVDLGIKDKHQDDIKNSDDKRSSRGDHSKDAIHKDERHTDKYQEDDDKDIQQREDKFRKDGDRNSRNRDDHSKDERHRDKYQEDDDKDIQQREDKFRKDGDRNSRNRDGIHKDERHRDKYQEDDDKDIQQREDKFRKDGDRNSRNRDDHSKDAMHKDERHRDKYQEDDDKDIQQREDKFRKDGDRNSRNRDAKYREDVEKDNRHWDEKYSEDSYRDDRHRDNKYRKDGDIDTRRKEDKYPEHGDKIDRHNGGKYRKDDKSIQHKKEKNHEHIERDSRHRDAKQKSESDRDREKRAKNVKFKDEHTSKAHDCESEMKHARNGSNAVDPNQRNSRNHDSGPIYDDRITGYKDNKGRRRLSDKEGPSDFRYASINEQHSDVENKSMNSGKVNIVTEKGEKGWSDSRKKDVYTSLDDSYRRNSPNSRLSSTDPAKDHHRVSNPEESKHRKYGYEEKVQHNRSSSKESSYAGRTEKHWTRSMEAGIPMTETILTCPRSSARPVEKYTQKDDSHFGALSAERNHRLDARASPLRVVDKSPSSTSTERRHLNSSEIRRTLNSEESAKRSCSSRDYSVRKEKGSVDLQKEMHPVDELSQADGESFSDLSPLKSNSNSSGNFLVPPFRTGLDCPSPFSYSEDDIRGRSNNHHRRNSISNMGRSPGNAWKGAPNWPSHVPNGFIPFQHVPPVNYHPLMQQFPAPPIFGVRSTMDLNNALPFHIPVTESFPGHGCSLGWRNPVDDSCPPVNGWDAHNAVFGDNTHGYRRSDWDQSRDQMSSRGWDTSADLRKEKNNGLSGDLPSLSQKEDSGTAKEVAAGQSGQPAQSELNHPNSQEDSRGVQSCDLLGNIIPEDPMGAPEKSCGILEMSGDDNASHCHIYLSRLDISTDLTQPDLYNQLTSLINKDQITAVEEIFEFNLADEIWTDTPVGAINDSVFQNAMSLYKNQREDIRAANIRKVYSSNMEIPKVIQTYNNGKGVLASPYDAHTVSDYDESVDTSSGLQEVEASPVTAFQKLDEPRVTDIVMVSKEQASVLDGMGMEVDPVSRQELADTTMDIKSAMQVEELSKALSQGNLEEMNKSDDVRGILSAANSKDNKLIEIKCGPMLYSDVSFGASEALMPELIESESVIISRIHGSTY